MDYEQYLQDRLDGMYSILESSDIVMEGLKKPNLGAFKQKFMGFLKREGKDKEFKKDVEKAKTMEERKKVAMKYERDVSAWCNRDGIRAAQLIGLIGGVTLANVGMGELAIVLYIMCWGRDIIAKHMGEKIADKIEDKAFK